MYALKIDRDLKYLGSQESNLHISMRIRKFKKKITKNNYQNAFQDPRD